MLLTGTMIVACGGNGAEEVPRSAEEIRLERACRIDSTSLKAVFNPDSLMESDGPKDLTAEAWLMVEDSTGLLISEKNANKRMFPASLTKMMTCLLALEKGNPDDSVYITDDVYIAKNSRVRLGDGYLLGNLVREMMLLSDNDAAYAIAKHVGGDTLSFCRMMNEKAAYLGMDSTHFANPNGMPNDSNYTTARDLMVLARYCMADSVFAEIVGTAFMDIPLIDKRHLPSDNTNALLQSYEGCFGVKTGFTRSAGYCLASAARRNGVSLYLVLLRSKSQASRFAESAAMLDYGFKVMAAYRQ